MRRIDGNRWELTRVGEWPRYVLSLHEGGLWMFQAFAEPTSQTGIAIPIRPEILTNFLNVILEVSYGCKLESIVRGVIA